ncbi:MAG: amino acid ABC transporter permease [Actinomycetes bacterium]|jgi:putative glutamine transport system permease protein|nr:amino acid ABC transporter permease [Actinomycetes bacterium]
MNAAVNTTTIGFMLSRPWFWASLLDGLKITLYISGVSILLAFVFGIVVGVARYSRAPVISWIATAYIEFIRNIPLILLMLFCFLVGQMKDVAAAILALTVFTTAVIAEVVRGGLNSVPKGQWEAARSQGMSYLQILRHIVLPQSVTKMIPPIVSQFVTAIKDSSFALLLGVVELTARGNILKSLFSGVGQILMIYAVIALFYFSINFAISLVARALQKRLSAGRGSIG